MTYKSVHSASANDTLPVAAGSYDIDGLLKRKMSERLERNDVNCFNDDFVEEYFWSDSENDKTEDNSDSVTGNVASVFGEFSERPEHGRNVTPRITNRGVSKYQSTIHPNAENLLTISERPTDSEVVGEYQRGGYDGGIEVGFEGRYIDGMANLLHELEKAKQMAMELSKSCPLKICGRLVYVECSGANAGLHYKYVFTLDGVKFLIHHNPPHDRQAIRVRYGATSLIGRNFFEVHDKVLEFLRDIGFVLVRECLSRVDVQVLVDEPINLFKALIKSNCAVSRVRKYDEFGISKDNHQAVETITYGSKSGRIELCIYDKMRELRHCMTSDLVKFELVLRYCLGDWFFDSEVQATRVEFRLWREVLREIGINTVADLRNRENDLVRWLTYDWFRILERPKVRGHENTATIHPLWQKVIDSFCHWFPGADDSRPILFDRKKPISCNPELLERQAIGCLSKAFAFRYGIQETLPMFRGVLNSFLSSKAGLMFDQMNDNARRIEVSKGVKLGENNQEDNFCNDNK